MTSKKPLRFVVHEHRASRLHYDFRLEIGGVLKSWAVPKGPSMNPADKRLAVMVPDHALEYFDFEGIIPEGEHGAGPVVVWDAGEFDPLDTDDPEEGLTLGRISFELRGKRLKGAFALARAGFALVHRPSMSTLNTDGDPSMFQWISTNSSAPGAI